MKWKEVAVTTTHGAADIVAEFLIELGSEGASIFDSKDFLELAKTDKNWDYADESLLKISDTVIVKGYFADTSCLPALSDMLDGLKSAGEIPSGSLEVNVHEIDGEDWLVSWKKFFVPIEIKDVAIVPEWIKYGGGAKFEVLIDPGMAFGTGSHETTSMCINLMQDIDLCGKTVIDVGCGSGILGIAALKCGASSAHLIDIDPIAVRAAAGNAALNGVTDRARISEGFLLKEASFSADVIFANITADALVSLSGDLPKYLNEGGSVILSGIIEGRSERVLGAYERVGLNAVSELRVGDWYAYRLERA